MKMPQNIPTLHAEYCRLAGVELRLRADSERLWFELVKDYAGDGNAVMTDLRIVVPYLKKQIGAEKRNPGCLRLRNLLQPDQWEGDVAEAKIVLNRRPARPATVQTTQQIGDSLRVIETPAPAAEPKPIAAEIAAGLRNFRETMKGKGNR